MDTSSVWLILCVRHKKLTGEGQERRHEFEGGGSQCIDQKLDYTVKTLKFEKSGGGMTPPPPMVAPPLEKVGL